MNNKPDSTRTEKLLSRISAGDRAATSELISLHRTYLRKVVDLRMDDEIRGRVDPSDVVQETQLIASQRFEDYLQRRPTSFRIWLRRKALEQLVEARRRHIHAGMRSVRREVAFSDQSSYAIVRGLLVAPPSQRLRRKELSDSVRRAVQQLSNNDREILLLRHVEELTNSEVAELLDIDAGAASQRYGRSVRRLREKLIKMGVSHES